MTIGWQEFDDKIIPGNNKERKTVSLSFGGIEDEELSRSCRILIKLILSGVEGIDIARLNLNRFRRNSCDQRNKAMK